MKKKAVYATLLLLVAVVAGASAQALRNEVFVEGGAFLMGTDNDQDNEKPMHEVTVSSFWIMKTEVTQADWTALMFDNPSFCKRDNLPVETVSWFEAVEYANLLSRKDGLQPAYRMNKSEVSCDFTKNGWRLPTEAEREYAAMGGNQSEGYTYAGSNSLEGVAWYGANSGTGTTHPVGTRRLNELGLSDMSGNVWEWCWDWYDSKYYTRSPSVDPRGPSSGTFRVQRGGGYDSTATYQRVAFRNFYAPSDRYADIGFRLVRPQF